MIRGVVAVLMFNKVVARRVVSYPEADNPYMLLQCFCLLLNLLF